MTQRTRGFTAVEMMVTLVLASIFAALAFPSFMDTVRNNRLSTTADQLVADLMIARREAIKHNGRVYMCPVGTTAGLCDTVNTTWANGWLVCYDLVDNSTSAVPHDDLCDPTSAADPNPILQRGKIDGSMTLTYPAVMVVFNGNGTRGVAGSTSFALRGTWGSTPTYCISLPTSGNILLTKIPGATCT